MPPSPPNDADRVGASDAVGVPEARFEPRVSVAALARLAPALAVGLGTVGRGGGVAVELIGSHVEARCVGCGIVVSGEELFTASMGTGVGSSPVETGGEKLRRLRLGYCARNTCTAEYYRVRWKPGADVDWPAVWPVAEAALGVSVGAAPVRSISLVAVILGSLRRLRLARREMAALGVVLLVFVVFVHRAGCRVPLLGPGGRVFIVPGAGPTSAPPTLPRPR